MSIPVNRPYITETDKKSVLAALEKTLLSGETEVVSNFEREFSNFFGKKYCVTTSTGTDAIDLAVSIIDFQKDEFVIMPTFTIISSMLQLARDRRKILLVDVEKDSFLANPLEISSLVNRNTKLIMIVHLYGFQMDMKSILESKKINSAVVIEDAAQSFNSIKNQVVAGTSGDMSVFSFYANKIITGGEGGAIITDSSILNDRLRSLRNLSFTKERFVSNQLGWNSRWNSMSAALASSQLSRIEQHKRRKIEISNHYEEGLKGHPWFKLPDRSKAQDDKGLWVYPILIRDDVKITAKELQEKLLMHKIETRRLFCPMHLQPAFKNLDITLSSNMKNSENLWEKGLYLPTGLGTTDDEIEKVTESLWAIYKFGRYA